MPEKLFSSKEAIEYLNLSTITFKRYVANPDIPLKGTLVTPRSRVFTQSELDRFKDYLRRHPVPGRGRLPYAQQLPLQRIADGIKALVLEKKRANPQRVKAALDAINQFETLPWNINLFRDTCPAFAIADDGAVTFVGDGNLFTAVIDSLAAYRREITF